MASLLTFPRAPRCLGCLRRTFLEDSAPAAPFSSPVRLQQYRGKKKLPQRTTIDVKLLNDVSGYGRKGSIVPVAPSRMRNLWYPQGRAVYVSREEKKSLGDITFERDHSFTKSKNKEAAKLAAQAVATDAAASVSRVPIARSVELIDTLVPETLEFRRQPIQTEPATAAGQVAADAPGHAGLLPSTSAIFGSVTTGDIASSIRASLLAGAAGSTSEEDAQRVLVAPEDVKIERRLDVVGPDQQPLPLSGEEEAGRIKTLGEWAVTIQLKRGKPVTRRVVVLAEAPLGDITAQPGAADAVGASV